MAEVNNSPKWDALRSPWYEVWYAKFNLLENGEAFWLRLTTLAIPGGKRTGEIWGIYFGRNPDGGVFHRAGKTTVSADEVRLLKQGIEIGRGDGASFWDDERRFTRGTAGPLGWDLRFQPRSGASRGGFSHVPLGLSRLRLNKSSVVTPWPDLLFEGTITVAGKTIPVKRASGMQGHIFGSKSAESWVWAHANVADGRDHFVFEGLSARIKAGGLLLLPPLSAFLFEWNEKRVEVNGTWEALSASSEIGNLSWRFKVRKGDYRFEGELRGSPTDFAGVRYEDTDGSSLYCHNSKVSTFDLKIFHGTALEAEVRSSSVAAFEIVSREKDPRIGFLL